VWPSAGYSARARTSGRIGFRPGPMVDDPALGLNRLRISLDTLPVEIPSGGQPLQDPSLLPVGE